MSDTKERAITRCSRNFGFHAYYAGPCFDKIEEAIAYRDKLDADEKRWPQYPARVGNDE